MLRKALTIMVILGISQFFQGSYCLGQEEGREKTLVLREGKQVRKNIVAVEAYCLDDVLQVRVEARMYSERPKITTVYLVGPKIGRMLYSRKEEIPINLTEKKPYLISKKGGLLSSRDNKEEKSPQGTLTDELFEFKIPYEKIVSGKKYQIWVYIEGKNTAGKRPQRFAFDIPDLAGFFSN